MGEPVEIRFKFNWVRFLENVDELGYWVGFLGNQLRKFGEGREFPDVGGLLNKMRKLHVGSK